MKKPHHITEIFLQPGDFYFGGRDTRIRTILGSCVSVIMWHPQRLIGGMCHYMLPGRIDTGDGTLDGRYADEAMGLFMQQIRAARTFPKDFQVKVFGGGEMFPGSCRDRPQAMRSDLPLRNRRIAHQLMDQYGLRVMSAQMGGAVHRQVLFDVWSGDAWVRQRPVVPSRQILVDLRKRAFPGEDAARVNSVNAVEVFA